MFYFICCCDLVRWLVRFYPLRFVTCMRLSGAARKAFTTSLMSPTAKLSSSMLLGNRARASFGLLVSNSSLTDGNKKTFILV